MKNHLFQLKSIILILIVVMLMLTACASYPKKVSQSSSVINSEENTESNETASSDLLENESGLSQSEEQVESLVSSDDDEIIYNVDWEKCIEDTRKGITGEFFPYVQDVYIEVKDDEKKIIFTAALDDSTDPKLALEYADTMIRQFNLYANIQDGNISLGNKEKFGGLYDTYSIMIGIAPANAGDDMDDWFLHDAIAAGVHTKHTLKLEKKYR